MGVYLTHSHVTVWYMILLQAALTSVALGQLDQLKALPGGPQGLLDLIKECPIMAEVSTAAHMGTTRCLVMSTRKLSHASNCLAMWLACRKLGGCCQ
jgi:hypothetical protein